MSHFLVAVITDEMEKITDYMNKYTDDGSTEEYLQFISVEDEMLKEYNELSVPMVRMSDGTLKEMWDETFAIKTSKEFYEKNKNIEGVYVTKKYTVNGTIYLHYDYSLGVVEDVPIRKVYSSFEEYVESMGYTKDDKTRKYGFWGNPNTKCDSWCIGGGWKDFLRASTGEHGNPTIEHKDGYYDIAKIKDVDFSCNEELKKRAKIYWETYVECEDVRPEIRERYIKEYKSKEQFIEENSKFVTFAVVTNDGQWHERGEMGILGIDASTNKEAKEWLDNWYDNFIKDTNSEWYIALVDCHI